MKLQFVKMHGVGNDFMVMHWPAEMAMPSSAQVQHWADRRRGPGFDQLMLIEDGYAGPEDASYRVFNADGSEVEQCGNGVRCVARLLAAESGSDHLRLASAAGVIEAIVQANGVVEVSLGEPNFAPQALPFAMQDESDRYSLTVNGSDLELGAVSVGNPHAVVLVDSVDDAPVGIMGKTLQEHAAFPSGVNVGFMTVRDAQTIDLRVFERGAGETLACGTGAAAAVALGRRWGVLDEKVIVRLPGGELAVNWQGPGEALWLAGPTTQIYDGRIEYESTKD
jgi:diaminopimelate epimerase